MPKYVAPGIHIKDVSLRIKTISGVSTSTVGFIGESERGPSVPTVITSYEQFLKIFGRLEFQSNGKRSKSYLPAAVHGFFLNGGTRCVVTRVVGKKGRELTLADYQGNVSGKSGTPRGLRALEGMDEVSLLCAPNEHDVGGLSESLVAHCEKMKDRFAILSAAKTMSPRSLRPPVASSYAAMYWPWINNRDPKTGRKKLVPPCGHIAGVYARTDLNKGVHKAPANEVLRGALDLPVQVNSAELQLLTRRGVNAIRAFSGRGIRVWGARTTSSDPEWKYVPVRRLAVFVEESVAKGTQWVVFEPNNESLWARVRMSIENFLSSQWRQGALLGKKSEEAFFVKCDRTTMTQNDIDNGRLICQIGIAPVRPAEFVIFRIGQKTASS
ncbi:phage tail sheath family protein [Candidatus Nitrospira salsa]